MLWHFICSALRHISAFKHFNIGVLYCKVISSLYSKINHPRYIVQIPIVPYNVGCIYIGSVFCRKQCFFVSGHAFINYIAVFLSQVFAAERVQSEQNRLFRHFCHPKGRLPARSSCPLSYLIFKSRQQSVSPTCHPTAQKHEFGIICADH